MKGSTAEEGVTSQQERGGPEPAGPPTVQPEPWRSAPGGSTSLRSRQWAALPPPTSTAEEDTETKAPPEPEGEAQGCGRAGGPLHAHEVSTGLHGGPVTSRGEL